MPALLDYLGVSWIQTESSALPQGSPNLPYNMNRSPKNNFFQTHFGQYLAFLGKAFEYLIFLDQIDRSLLGAICLGSKEVKLVISQISIFLGI